MEGFSIRRFLWALLAFLGVLVVGTIGFYLITDEGWSSSFYRSVVSTTLTGLDSRPDGTAAELFTVGLLLAGVAIFLYIAGSLVELIARGALAGALGERRRKKAIQALQGHVIICGYGRVGRSAAREFEQLGVDFVVLDIGEEAIALAAEQRVPYVHGSGTNDEDLDRAGLTRARGLLASADSDVDNLYVTLSARARRSDLHIVARASTRDAAAKLTLAGADRVVQPYAAAGLRMANFVLKPQVSEFLDILSTAGGPLPEMRFEEIVVTDNCPSCGKTLGELRVQEATGALVVGLRKVDGRFDVTPGAEARVDEGDVVIGVGTTEEMARLEALFAPRAVIIG